MMMVLEKNSGNHRGSCNSSRPMGVFTKFHGNQPASWGITTINRLHYLGNINVCKTFCTDSSSRCLRRSVFSQRFWDISQDKWKYDLDTKSESSKSEGIIPFFFFFLHSLTLSDCSSSLCLHGRLWLRGKSGHPLTRRSVVWSKSSPSACRSVLGQDTEPRNAPHRKCATQ